MTSTAAALVALTAPLANAWPPWVVLDTLSSFTSSTRVLSRQLRCRSLGARTPTLGSQTRSMLLAAGAAGALAKVVLVVTANEGAAVVSNCSAE